MRRDVFRNIEDMRIMAQFFRVRKNMRWTKKHTHKSVKMSEWKKKMNVCKC